MCFQSTTSSNNDSQQTLDTWLQNNSAALTHRADQATSTPYQGYAGPTSAAFGPTFQTAENAATSQLASQNPNYAAGTQALAQGLGLAAQTAGTPVSQLMSQYTNAALQPTLQAIQQQAANNNSGLAQQATMSGAFGDTGYGAAKALNDYNTTQAISGATANAYNQAYNTALQTQQTALGQLFGGVGQATNLGASQNQSQTSIESLLGNLGMAQQQAGQTGINTAINVNNQNQMGYLQQLGLAAGATAAAPHQTYTNGQASQTQPDNTGFGLLGTLLAGASMPMSTFGGYNYGDPEIASAAQAGVQGGLSFNPLNGEVW